MRKIIYAFAFVFIALTISVSAELEVSLNPDSGVVTASFKTVENDYVHIQVLQKDKTTIDLYSCSLNSLNTVIAYEQTKIADASGEVSFSFKVDGESGNYLIRIKGFNTGKIQEMIYHYTRPSEIKAIVQQVIDADSADVVKSILEKSWDGLDINRSLLSKINPNALYKKVYEYNGFDAQIPSKFIEYINDTIVLQALSQVAEDDLMSYDKVLKFSNQSTYATYLKLSDSQKQLVKESFRNHDLTDFGSARNLFDESTILTAVRYIEYWKSVSTLLKDNNTIIELDFTNYNKLRDTYPVDSGIAKKSFSSLKELRDTFYSLVEGALNKKGGNDAPSSPRSSGGSFSVGNPAPEKLENTPYEMPNMFDDIESVEWAVESINNLYIKGIINGVGNRKFAPNNNVTREEFTKMLVVALGIYDENAMSDFSDSMFGEWHYVYISSAYKNGIVNGLSDDRFGVGEKLLRQDLAVICARGIGLSDNQCDYLDTDSISDYAKGAVGALQKVGIMEGSDGNKFLPEEAVTRAQAAKVIYKIIQLKEAVK